MKFTAFFYTALKLDFLTIAFIIIGVLVFISGLSISICLVCYYHVFRKLPSNLHNVSHIKSQLCPSSPIQIRSPIISRSNNFQPGNEIILEEKQPSISISQTSPLFSSSDVSLKQENPAFDDFSEGIQYHHDDVDFLELGSRLIDRPLSMALQPLDIMGSVLMKFNMCEQHWIRRNDQ